MKFKYKLNKIVSSTIERPTILEADALVRYNFAKKFCKQKKVLDIGCGVGVGSAYIASHGSNEILGIDYSKSAIRNAKDNPNFKKLDNLKFSVNNALSLNLIKRKFDVILAFEIIEHLPVSQAHLFLKQIHARLNKGGILILSTPNELHTVYFLGKPYNPFHIKEYRAEEITHLLKNHFSKISMYGIRCVNNNKRKERITIEKKLPYRVAFILGHFRFVRNLLGFVPQKFKNAITQEHTLAKLEIKDFIIDKNIKDSEGLFAIARY